MGQRKVISREKPTAVSSNSKTKLSEQIVQGNVALIIGPDALLRIPSEEEASTDADMKALRECNGSMEKWIIHQYKELRKQLEGAITERQSLDDYYYVSKLTALRSEIADFFENKYEDYEFYVLDSTDINPHLKALIETKLFRLILTTDYDPLLENYLREIWGDSLQVKNIFLDGDKRDLAPLENYPLQSDMPPTLFYLFGKTSERSDFPQLLPPYAALEEDKIRAIRHWIKTPPPNLTKLLQKKSIMAIGCRFDDWLFRFFWFGALERDHSPQNACNMLAISFDDKKDESLLNFLKRKDFPTKKKVNEYLDELVSELHTAAKDYFKTAREKGGVFISYKSANRFYAQRLFFALRANNIKAWYDERELESGDKYNDRIMEAIESCSVFVPLLSPDTAADTKPCLDCNNERAENFCYYRDREWNHAIRTQTSRKIKIERGEIVPIGPLHILPLALPGYDIRKGHAQEITNMFPEILTSTTLQDYSVASITHLIDNIKRLQKTS